MWPRKREGGYTHTHTHTQRQAREGTKCGVLEADGLFACFSFLFFVVVCVCECIVSWPNRLHVVGVSSSSLFVLVVKQIQRHTDSTHVWLSLLPPHRHHLCVCACVFNIYQSLIKTDPTHST